MQKTLKQIFKKYTVSFGLLVVCLSISFAFYTLVTAPKNFVFTEQLQYSAAPNAQVKHTFLSFGQLGLWDNSNGLGYPLIGHISSNFYPISILGFLIPDDLFSIRLQVFVHLLLGGIACFYLLSVLKVKIPSRILGSVCFVVNDYVYFAVYRGFLPETTNLVWMALSVAFLWQAFFKNRSIFAVLCGITLAIHVIAMISYSLYFTSIILIFLTIYYIFYQKITQKESFTETLLFVSKTIGVTALVFLGISAIKLLPVLQYSWYSTRSSYPLYLGSIPGTWQLATLDSVMHYLTNFLIPEGQVPIKYGFAIVLTFLANTLFFVFILFSILKKSKAVYFFWTMSFFVLWAAMGNHAPLDMYKVFYFVFPGIKTLNYPQRLFIITNLTLPILAAFGLDVLLQIGKKYRYILAILPLGVILVATLYVRAQMIHYTHITPDHRTFHPDNVFLQQIETLTHKEKDIVHVGSTYYQDSKTVGSYTAVYGNFLLANPPVESFQLTYQHMPLFTINGHPTDDFLRKKYTYLSLMNVKYFVTTNMYDDHANAYKSLLFTSQKNSTEDGSIYQIKNTKPFISSTPYALLFIGNDTNHDFNALKVKSLVLSKSFDIQKFTIFSTDEHVSYETLRSFDAVIVDSSTNIPQEVREYQKQGGEVLSLHFLSRNYDDLANRSDSLFYSSPAIYLSPADQDSFDSLLQESLKSKQVDNASIHMLSFTPENIVFSINTGKPTAITITDTYFPGWIATSDTNQTMVFMSDGLLKGIIMLPGMHIITLHFFPVLFYIGTAITGISFVVLIVYFLKVVKL